MAFHLHVPKPLHGWKPVINEVFAIVIGVLPALGLEAGIARLHWQQKAGDGRERPKPELATTLSNPNRPWSSQTWDAMRQDGTANPASASEQLVPGAVHARLQDWRPIVEKFKPGG